MHELSIAVALVEQLEAIAQREGSRLRAVALRIGTLSGVDPDALDMAFPVAAEGTAVEGAELSLQEVPARARCGACNREYEPEFPFLVCETCGADDVTVLSGRELLIQTVELEDPEQEGTLPGIAQDKEPAGEPTPRPTTLTKESDHV